MKDAKVCLNDPAKVVPEWKENASLVEELCQE